MQTAIISGPFIFLLTLNLIISNFSFSKYSFIFLHMLFSSNHSSSYFHSRDIAKRKEYVFYKVYEKLKKNLKSNRDLNLYEELRERSEILN